MAIAAAKSFFGGFTKFLLGKAVNRDDRLGNRENRKKLAARAFLEGYEPDPRLFAKGPDDAPDVFMPEPLAEPVQTYLPPQPQAPQLVGATTGAVGEEFVVREIERINANVNAIALAMEANAKADADYRQSIIRQQKDRLAQRGAARSRRRSSRSRGVRNFLRKRSSGLRRGFTSTFSGFRGNFAAFAALEAVDQLQKRFDTIVDNVVNILPKQIRDMLGLEPRPEEREKTKVTPGTITNTDLSSLMRRISGGEGGIDSYNTGTAGSQAGYKPPKPISQMTVGQIMRDQADDKLFAVGKYQITPETMKGFIETMRIGKGEIFNEELQNKFGRYFTEFKRPVVGQYLRGEGPTLEEALIAVAAEFASVGVPRDMKQGEYVPYSRYLGGPIPSRDIRKGESLYVGYGGNAAQAGAMEDIRNILENMRSSAVTKQKVANANDFPMEIALDKRYIPIATFGEGMSMMEPTIVDLRTKEFNSPGGATASSDFDVSKVILDPFVNPSEYAGLLGVN
jgi:hypothetical protein